VAKPRRRKKRTINRTMTVLTRRSLAMHGIPNQLALFVSFALRQRCFGLFFFAFEYVNVVSGARILCRSLMN
jgi:hypothetical protein